MEQTVAASSKGERPFRFSIDRGGTFTDVYAEVPGSKGFRVLKLLSEDPHNYPDAPREGVRRILEVRPCIYFVAMDVLCRRALRRMGW